MAKYTVELPGHEYFDDFTVEAHDIHHACRIVRQMLAKPDVWAGGSPTFTENVVVSGPNSTVKMLVECCV